MFKIDLFSILQDQAYLFEEKGRSLAPLYIEKLQFRLRCTKRRLYALQIWEGRNLCQTCPRL